MTQVQASIDGFGQWPASAATREGLLDRARARVEREKDLATSTEAAHYAPASLGQSPYVAVPGVGTIVYRKCQWGC